MTKNQIAMLTNRRNGRTNAQFIAEFRAEYPTLTEPFTDNAITAIIGYSANIRAAKHSLTNYDPRRFNSALHTIDSTGEIIPTKTAGSRPHTAYDIHAKFDTAETPAATVETVEPTPVETVEPVEPATVEPAATKRPKRNRAKKTAEPATV